MKLERLELISLPGITDRFAVDGFADTLTLISGPNAVGKSSLLRALDLLLSEPKKNDPPVTLSAEFSDQDRRWRVVRTGQQIEWTLDGASATRPNLPSADELGRYCLSMEALIKADASDSSLAAELQRSIHGGFDLAAVRRRVSISARHAQSVVKQHREALSRVRHAEAAAEALCARQENLPELESRIEASRVAQTQVGLIEGAIALLEATRERERVQRALAEFPEHMDKLTGHEPEQVQNLRARLDKRRRDLHEQERRRQEAQDSLQASGLGDADLERAAADLAAVERILRDIETAQHDRAHLQATLDSERIAHERASTALGGHRMPKLDSEHLEEAEGFAAEVLELRALMSELEARVGLLGAGPDAGELRNHQRAIDALCDWLYAHSAGSGKRGMTTMVLTALVLALASVALDVLPGVSELLPIILSSTLGLLLLWLLVRLRSVSGTGIKDAVERFRKTGLAAPEWHPDEVRDRLKELGEALAELDAQKRMAEGGDAARARLSELATRLKEQEADSARLCERIGFDPSLPLTALDRFIRLAREWDETGKAIETTEARLARADAAINTGLEEGQETLLRWQAPRDAHIPRNDFAQLDAARAALKKRLEQAHKATGALEQAKRDVQSAQDDISAHGEDLARVFTNAGLGEQDSELLDERVQRLSSWKALGHELTEIETREKLVRQDLHTQDALLALARQQDESGLGAQLRAQRELAEQLEAHLDARTKLIADIERAESERGLEAAVALRTESETRLAEKRAEILDQRATELLLNQVEQDYRSTHEPEVLRQADALFRQITDNAFELGLATPQDASSGDVALGFQARDTRTDLVRELHQLSTGTRMQLLLAVRVAWVRAQGTDGRPMMPLFLDEALTTSDERRFMLVAKSLERMSSASGIQVIYLSARTHEKHLWREALGRDLEWIDLEEIRTGAAGASSTRDDAPLPDFALAPPQAVPEPDGDDAVAYAKRLGVAPIDPWKGAGDIHIFHVLRDDLVRLHWHLDSLRIRRLGPLESWLHQARNARPREAAESVRLLRRCRAAHAWVAAWQEGRERPIGAHELLASGAFSDKYQDQAAQLVNSEAVAGSPARMLAALRDKTLKGFHHSKINQLEEWLKAQGFLASRSTLSRDERCRRVLLGAHGDTHIEDVRQCIEWLEAGIADLPDAVTDRQP